MRPYVIALGGNIGNPQECFRRALEHIRAEVGPISARASLYWTRPLIHPSAPVRQDLYLNTVIVCESDLEPEEVLQRLLDIECLLGRVRANEQIPWGPRTIDLDLVAAADCVLSTPSLNLPHPEMHKRDFVLLPMLEVQPDWQHPVLGKSLEALVDALEETWIVERIDDQVRTANL